MCSPTTHRPVIPDPARDRVFVQTDVFDTGWTSPELQASTDDETWTPVLRAAPMTQGSSGPALRGRRSARLDHRHLGRHGHQYVELDRGLRGRRRDLDGECRSARHAAGRAAVGRGQRRRHRPRVHGRGLRRDQRLDHPARAGRTDRQHQRHPYRPCRPMPVHPSRGPTAHRHPPRPGLGTGSRHVGAPSRLWAEVAPIRSRPVRLAPDAGAAALAADDGLTTPAFERDAAARADAARWPAADGGAVGLAPDQGAATAGSGLQLDAAVAAMAGRDDQRP